MSAKIYSKPVAFALLATFLILIGTLVTTFLPMASESMHPKLENLMPYSPLELAGRDVYQAEGCVNCHTQTVRPLKAEVKRYGEYSKAGEFAYDRPFLWGSKRTGPDLARVGLRYPEKLHYDHFMDPQAIVPKSNMPAYGFLKDNALNAGSVKKHMDALGLPYEQSDMDALKGKNELDALVAYMLSLGHAVKKAPSVAEAAEMSLGALKYAEFCAGCHGDGREGGFGPSLQEVALSEGDLKDIILKGTGGGMPPFEGAMDGVELDALADFLLMKESRAEAPPSAGLDLFLANCAACHDANGTGGFGPNLTDNVWLGAEGAIDDTRLKEIILKGTGGGMPPFGSTLSEAEVGDVVSHIRSLGKY